MNQRWRRYRLGAFALLGALLIWLASATPGYSHWADLAVAEISVEDAAVQMTLTIPTGLVAISDDNRDGQLSEREIRTHSATLQRVLGEKIYVTDAANQNSMPTVQPSSSSAVPTNLQANSTSHSTLRLVYSPKSMDGLKIHYGLFLPGVPTARCLATISSAQQVQNVIFSPENQTASLTQGSALNLKGGFWATILGAFVWGALHSMSPGHGKTIVGAYLSGSRATTQHALFLGLTTTITHTLGVFALGLVALFASRSILAEQLFPWLSLASGLMVVGIGLNLLWGRLQHTPLVKTVLLKKQSGTAALAYAGHSHAHGHPHTHAHSHAHSHVDGHVHPHHEHHVHPDHSHSHHHSHPDHSHDHSHHHHSHLPSGAGSPVTWRSLLMLGISGGILPCPSALVLLLSAIALGQIGYGLVLVLAFSLGLAAILTGLGLLMIYARQFFDRLPKQAWFGQVWPTVSAGVIALIGLGITTQAIWQIGVGKLG